MLACTRAGPGGLSPATGPSIAIPLCLSQAVHTRLSDSGSSFSENSALAFSRPILTFFS
jgi:hypothetical protein